jgi:hypothetical protein
VAGNDAADRASETRLADGLRSLLTGEAASVEKLLNLHLGSAEVLLAVTIDFRDNLPGGANEQAAIERTRRVEASHPEITRLLLRPRRQGPGS